VFWQNWAALLSSFYELILRVSASCHLITGTVSIHNGSYQCWPVPVTETEVVPSFVQHPCFPFISTENLWDSVFKLPFQVLQPFLLTIFYITLLICYSQLFSNIFITFIISHSASCDFSDETHFCCLHSSCLFLLIPNIRRHIKAHASFIKRIKSILNDLRFQITDSVTGIWNCCLSK
jgi:hypothetical protein